VDGAGERGEREVEEEDGGLGGWVAYGVMAFAKVYWGCKISNVIGILA